MSMFKWDVVYDGKTPPLEQGSGIMESRPVSEEVESSGLDDIHERPPVRGFLNRCIRAQRIGQVRVLGVFRRRVEDESHASERRLIPEPVQKFEAGLSRLTEIRDHERRIGIGSSILIRAFPFQITYRLLHRLDSPATGEQFRLEEGVGENERMAGVILDEEEGEIVDFCTGQESEALAQKIPTGVAEGGQIPDQPFSSLQLKPVVPEKILVLQRQKQGFGHHRVFQGSPDDGAGAHLQTDRAEFGLGDRRQHDHRQVRPELLNPGDAREFIGGIDGEDDGVAGITGDPLDPVVDPCDCLEPQRWFTLTEFTRDRVPQLRVAGDHQDVLVIHRT